MTQDLDKLKEWIGQREEAVDYVTVPLVHRLAATLDRDDPFPRVGDVLPRGWHTVLFPRVVRHSEIGTDGHPKRGDFLPPVALPRRMFGGKRETFVSDLRVGDEVRRESVIKDVTPKRGRSGPMVFVTVQTNLIGPRGLAVSEEQDIIYRDNPDPNAPPAAPHPVPGNAIWSRSMSADPVLLFRYSALTFNGHRIHYDWRYVTNEEGYPDLIVNGRLQTLLVCELVRAHASSPIRSMSSRNVRPLFVNRPFAICGEPAADNRTAKLWVADQDGAPTLIAEADFA